MRSRDADVLIIPGLGGSGPDHWQSRWQAKLPNARRVEQADWDHPDKAAWLARIAETVAEASRPRRADRPFARGDRCRASDPRLRPGPHRRRLPGNAARRRQDRGNSGDRLRFPALSGRAVALPFRAGRQHGRPLFLDRRGTRPCGSLGRTLCGGRCGGAHQPRIRPWSLAGRPDDLRGLPVEALRIRRSPCGLRLGRTSV